MICATYRTLRIPRGAMNGNWELALSWLKEERWLGLGPGRVEIREDQVFATVSDYRTTPVSESSRWETHRLYADIQMLMEGAELILLCDPAGLEIIEPYDPRKDIGFFGGWPATTHRLQLGGPLAGVFFPDDAHWPCLSEGSEGTSVRKLVIKVRLS